jgi:hypothetical protein
MRALIFPPRLEYEASKATNKKPVKQKSWGLIACRPKIVFDAAKNHLA